MEYKIIHTDSYLLVVDDSEIKKGDYYKDTYKIWQWNDDCSLLGRKKIIAHLPLNNSPILEGVDFLPDLEAEKEKLKFCLSNVMQQSEQLFDFLRWYSNQRNLEYSDSHILVMVEKYLKSKGDSLQQPKLPIAFECEMETTSYADDTWASDGGYYTKRYTVIEPKTTTNSQGQTVWVGTYKY